MAKEANQGIVAEVNREEFLALAKEANSGDPVALAKLRHTLANNPSISHHMGDLAAMAERSLTAEILKNDPSACEIIAAKVDQMRQSLVGTSDSLVVRLAADRVLLTWLSIYLLDLRYSDVAITSLPSVEATVVIKQKVAAERRHLLALRIYSAC
jgi:hypothetical protein